MIVEQFRPGVLIVLESTTYPGTTEAVILSRLDSGVALVGKDFFSPFLANAWIRAMARGRRVIRTRLSVV